jgi:predicted anti-sigma-YlaC factor YlaD
MIRDAFRRARAEASWQQWALLAVGLACAIAVRFSLGPLSTGDYTHFMKGWMGLLRVSVTPRFRPLLRPVWS